MIQNSIAPNLGGSGGGVAVGSYVGTGTFGAGNPCSVTCDFEIKAFLIIPDDPLIRNDATYTGFTVMPKAWILGETSPKIAYAHWDDQFKWDPYVTVAWNGKTLSWYSDSVVFQQNVSGNTYRWIAWG